MKKILDITRTIKEDMAVWPGDASPKIYEDSLIQNGAAANVGSVRMGLHTGTHVDAPLHYIEGSAPLSAMELSCFMGSAKVFYIDTEDIITYSHIEKLNIQEGDIVLFKTINSLIKEGDGFHKDFVSLDIYAARHLVSKKIKSVGIDYLSIEAFSGDGSVHKALLGAGIAIIEGLNLKYADEGEYFISCLPLKIENVEASPVRAVLFK